MSHKIPQEFIDTLLAQADIVEVVNAYVPLKKAGRDYQACCPFHSDKSPSFTVSPSKGFYHCFGCGANGNAIMFLMEYNNSGFVDAVRELAELVRLPMPERAISPQESAEYEAHLKLYTLLAEADSYFQKKLRDPEVATEAAAYLKQRGLSGEIAKEYGIGYAPAGKQAFVRTRPKDERKLLLEAGIAKTDENGDEIYDYFRHRVTFPIRDRKGRVIGFGGRVLDDSKPKYLNTPETALFHKRTGLYGLYEARQKVRDWSYMLVVEGYMDVLALAQHEIRNVVATLGTATTKEHLELLFRQTSEVIFCFDGDAAGRQAAWRTLPEIMPMMRDGRQARFIFLPPEDDPDSLVRRVGASAFRALIEEATPLSDFLLQQLAEKVDLRHVEGLNQLITEARPFITAMPEGLYRRMMIERLAEWANLDPYELMRSFGLLATGKSKKAPEAPPVAAPPSGRELLAKLDPLVRQALALLVQHPALGTSLPVPVSLRQLSLPGSKLLIEILDLLQRMPNLTPPALIEHWRDKIEHPYLLALLESDPPMARFAEALQVEWGDLLAKLDARRAQKRKSDLLEKLKQGTLQGEERAELQRLMVLRAG